MRRVLMSLGLALAFSCGAPSAAPREPLGIPSSTAVSTATSSTTAPATLARTVAPRVAPTVAPPASQAAPATAVSLCGAASNPWGYNFCGGGTFITSPPATFCSYFACIASFSSGRGYVMQCVDSTFSKSGGISGSCSGHGGNSRALKSPTA
jgi:hypothetical protein